MTGRDAAPLPTARFDYELPPELIAQTPLEPRDASRLLAVDRATGALADHTFRELPRLLRAGDLLVINDTRVLPARLRARRTSGGAVELLLLSRRADGAWEALARPARRVRAGEELALLDASGAVTADSVAVVERDAEQVVVRFADEGSIQRHGQTPLPPYVRGKLDDPERYQTVYATHEGSAAAPTAGLHFTPRVFEECATAGIGVARVTLHVGLGTFQPIRTDDARDHRMHAEWFNVPAATLAALTATRQRGGRVIAVGSTAMRTLESLPDGILDDAAPKDYADWTELYITPGFKFRLVSGLLTNFHLPRTTLLLMVAAFAGEAAMRRAYAHAVAQRYRFYSFGDAMLIV